jgi:hypothetical protein
MTSSKKQKLDDSDPRPPSLIPTAASSWDKTVLETLNAKFQPNDVHTYNILASPGGLPSLPPDLEIGQCPFVEILRIVVESIANELAKINNGKCIRPGFEYDDNQPNPKMNLFWHFYSDLDQTNRKEKDPADTAVRYQSPATESTSSGGPTDETYTNSSANHVLAAAFRASKIPDHSWWAENKDYQLRFAEFSSLVLSLIILVNKERPSNWVYRRIVKGDL